jgi:hypothetical protein
VQWQIDSVEDGGSVAGASGDARAFRRDRARNAIRSDYSLVA